MLAIVRDSFFLASFLLKLGQQIAYSSVHDFGTSENGKKEATFAANDLLRALAVMEYV
jgi:hypothetical protein